MTAEPTTTDPARFWDELYRARSGAMGERVNPLLAEIAGPLVPGAALDLGCGVGGDTLWLAGRGWCVTGVDISAVAVESLRDKARALGHGDRVTTTTVDLAQDFPGGTFDLISAQYLQSPFALGRVRTLRAAADALRPGGRLVVVDHGSVAPWSWNTDADFPTPAEVADELGLDHRWRIERADMPKRQATGPTGQTAEVIDNVLVIHRP